MSSNRPTYRDPVRLPSRPLHDRARSQYSGSMAYSGKRRRQRKPRKIGRKILGLLVLGVILWYGRAEIISTVQGWLGMEVADETTAGVVETDIQTGTDAESTGTESAESASESTPDDSVNRAGLMSKAGDWLEERLRGVFTVKEIELSGTRSLEKDSLLSGLDELHGHPLLELDSPWLADSLKQHPRIQDVIIERQFPSTVKVEVTERREVAVLISNGGVWGIDGQRVVMPLPGRAWPLDLPVISGLMKDPKQGSTLTQPVLVAAMDWVQAVSDLPRMQAWLSEIHITGDSIAWISGADGHVVLPGMHDVVAQVATLDAFLASDDKDDGRIIDLSLPDYLIVRDEPRSASGTEEG